MLHQQKISLPHRFHEKGLRKERQSETDKLLHDELQDAPLEHPGKVFVAHGKEDREEGEGDTGVNSTE